MAFETALKKSKQHLVLFWCCFRYRANPRHYWVSAVSAVLRGIFKKHFELKKCVAPDQTIYSSLANNKTNYIFNANTHTAAN